MNNLKNELESAAIAVIEDGYHDTESVGNLIRIAGKCAGVLEVMGELNFMQLMKDVSVLSAKAGEGLPA